MGINWDIYVFFGIFSIFSAGFFHFFRYPSVFSGSFPVFPFAFNFFMLFYTYFDLQIGLNTTYLSGTYMYLTCPPPPPGAAAAAPLPRRRLAAAPARAHRFEPSGPAGSLPRRCSTVLHMCAVASQRSTASKKQCTKVLKFSGITSVFSSSIPFILVHLHCSPEYHPVLTCLEALERKPPAPHLITKRGTIMPPCRPNLKLLYLPTPCSRARSLL